MLHKSIVFTMMIPQKLSSFCPSVYFDHFEVHCLCFINLSCLSWSVYFLLLGKYYECARQCLMVDGNRNQSAWQRWYWFTFLECMRYQNLNDMYVKCLIFISVWHSGHDMMQCEIRAGQQTTGQRWNWELVSF